jgi:plasmid stabilization system protein ParE
VDLSALAENDLIDIVRYISAQLLAPTTALKMLDAIEEA